MTTYVEFECGDGEVLNPSRSVQDAMDDHDATCRLCPDLRTGHEKHLDQLRQKKWEAHVDAAVTEAKAHP